MGYKTDWPPIDYLKRRLIYYKKKRGRLIGFLNRKSFLVAYGGKKKLQKIIDSGVGKVDELIKHFEAAIKKLEP